MKALNLISRLWSLLALRKHHHMLANVQALGKMGILVLVPCVTAEAVVSSGWELESTLSKAGEQPTQIMEAVLREKGFINTFEMRVGCRYSFPVPSIVLSMPALSTDILEPENKAVILFTDEPNSPKKYESGIVLSVIVKHGDLVMVPTGNAEQSAKLEEVYRLLLAGAKAQKNNVSMFFIQNRHRRRIDLNLQNFDRQYGVMRESCAELK